MTDQNTQIKEPSYKINKEQALIELRRILEEYKDDLESAVSAYSSVLRCYIGDPEILEVFQSIEEL